MTSVRPRASTYFERFAPPVQPQSPLRQAITAAYRRPESDCLPPLLEAARTTPEQQIKIRDTARTLITALRGKDRASVVEELVHEYSLSSQEGVALMCLAEALLRIPDTDTRDALIRDKISDGNWAAHLGGGRSLFVNAATWGLVLTGRLTAPVSENSLGGALTKLIARFGEPVIRRGVDMAMRMMGEQFVMGETIDEAIARAVPEEAKGFRYSYDMLGEAAMTAEDAERYYQSYEDAIHAIGKASNGRGLYDGPGISIKLSALHPRYVRAQAARVMTELLPRVEALALLAKTYNIGLNIDAEEADRLELSLDILEALCTAPSLAGWDGMGFVVQAYGKRCPFVIDFIIDLAARANRRIMVRLVKGAYWDAEIKRAQVDGLDGFPVFTRKPYTDVSYLACARKLLNARRWVFPQFATHNAQSLAAIYHMAGPNFSVGDYEFQCLHGMGEPLYEEVVGRTHLNRPCRIYAPVGTHETLLAYLVRRLLENGANSSFVNRIADEAVAIDELIDDPVSAVAGMAQVGAVHEAIRLPVDLYGGRRNSQGLDLSNEQALAALSEALSASTTEVWHAGSGVADQGAPVLNPADHADVVGTVREASDAEIAAAVQAAATAAGPWAHVPAHARAEMLEKAADLLQERLPLLLGLIMREAGKSAPNAISEVREAIDFLRYYAAEAARGLATAAPLGPVACISPWNFPLAIFMGQVAAALVAGNPVLAKPAEETPLIAAEAVRILHEAGVPQDVVQLLAGDGRVGGALTGHALVQGVMFTGSTDVARLIQRTLAQRLSPAGQPIPLIAETGGQNAMVVDSSALAEQVVGDVIASAFDSAGQRCSALRILCLQDDIAERTISMLRGALKELTVGPTDRLSVDIGPVITEDARNNIEAHIKAMHARGHHVEQLPLPGGTENGTFVSPTIIGINKISDVEREVFGPVLHVLRYRRDALPALIADINSTGFGLTFGLHTRIDETIAAVASHVQAGNIYINRNVIGAVVGVQPFGGRGLSGTGPKAGGPLYLRRLVQQAAAPAFKGHRDEVAQAFAGWLRAQGQTAAADAADAATAMGLNGYTAALPGPVGETNHYGLEPRGNVLLLPESREGLFAQLAAALANGDRAVICAGDDVFAGLGATLPAAVRGRVKRVVSIAAAGAVSVALTEAQDAALTEQLTQIAALPGPIISVLCADERGQYRPEMLVEEQVVTTNTTAAGGNASLMTLAL